MNDEQDQKSARPEQSAKKDARPEAEATAAAAAAARPDVPQNDAEKPAAGAPTADAGGGDPVRAQAPTAQPTKTMADGQDVIEGTGTVSDAPVYSEHHLTNLLHLREAVTDLNNELRFMLDMIKVRVHTAEGIVTHSLREAILHITKDLP